VFFVLQLETRVHEDDVRVPEADEVADLVLPHPRIHALIVDLDSERITPFVAGLVDGAEAASGDLVAEHVFDPVVFEGAILGQIGLIDHSYLYADLTHCIAHFGTRLHEKLEKSIGSLPKDIGVNAVGCRSCGYLPPIGPSLRLAHDSRWA